MKYFVVICFAFYTTTSFHVFGAIQNDTINTEDAEKIIPPRSFDRNIIEAFKNDSDFVYELPPETRPNYLQMIFRKFFEWLIFIFGNESVAWLILIVLIILGVVGLGFAFYGVFGVGKTIPVYSKEIDDMDYTVKDENIHEMNFADEINIAAEHKDFRKAIRLIYLYTLKLLTDRKIIDWKPSKTNQDYLYEIQSASHQKLFSNLCYYFEYVWYGEFQPSEKQYSDMKNSFAGLENELKQNGKV